MIALPTQFLVDVLAEYKFQILIKLRRLDIEHRLANTKGHFPIE